jgi:hypothetical protein
MDIRIFFEEPKGKKGEEPKGKKGFDLYETEIYEELDKVIDYHKEPVLGWVQGNITQTKYTTDTKNGIYATLEEAHQAFLKYIKPRIKENDNQYGGIVKTTRGYMLKPNFHPKGFQKYSETNSGHRRQLKNWIFWEFKF